MEVRDEARGDAVLHVHVFREDPDVHFIAEAHPRAGIAIPAGDEATPFVAFRHVVADVLEREPGPGGRSGRLTGPSEGRRIGASLPL